MAAQVCAATHRLCPSLPEGIGTRGKGPDTESLGCCEPWAGWMGLAVPHPTAPHGHCVLGASRIIAEALIGLDGWIHAQDEQTDKAA